MAAKRKFRRWTTIEVAALKSGVAKYGVSRWIDILNDQKFAPFLSTRTNIDLKDKWRNMTCKASSNTLVSIQSSSCEQMSPYKQTPSPYKQTMSPYKQATPPYKQTTSPYKQTTSPYKQSGFSFRQNQICRISPAKKWLLLVITTLTVLGLVIQTYRKLNHVLTVRFSWLEIGYMILTGKLISKTWKDLRVFVRRVWRLYLWLKRFNKNVCWFIDRFARL